MKKYFFAVATISLMAISCNVFESPQSGILKTANGGVDWQSSNKVKGNEKASTAGLSITKLGFDPQRNDILYAAASNAGLWKSEDGGESWEQILGTIPVTDFVVNPVDTKIIYAAGSFDTRARVLATRDGGKSWNEVYNEGSKSTSVRAIALNPGNISEVIIGLSYGALIKSTDNGQNWKLMQTYKDRVNQIIWDNSGMYVLIRNKGLYKSTDGGSNFQYLTANIRSNAQKDSSVFGSAISNYSQIAISRQNSSIIFLTTNAGMFRSDNGGQGWNFVSMPLRQKQVAPSALAVAPSSDSVVYAGAGNIIYKTSDGGNSWQTSDTGTKNQINALLVSPELPQVAYAGVGVKQGISF